MRHYFHSGSICILIMASIFAVIISSCQKFEEINRRLDILEYEVSELKAAEKALQNAYDKAKVISSITPVTEVAAGGWTISFTDGSIIRIINADPSYEGHLIESISEDEKTHVVTMVLANGNIFRFNIQHISPTSIIVLNTSPIYIATEEEAAIEFRVNPSNATFIMEGDDCQIELDLVETVQTKSSYVAQSPDFKLIRIEQAVDEQSGEVKTGQYRAIIKDAGRSAAYDQMVALVLDVKDTEGNDVLISSDAFEIIGKNFDCLPVTGLPVLLIDTPGNEPVKSKETWVEGSAMAIVNSDMTYDYRGTLSVKGRGNSTWLFPKKAYTLKLDSKSKVLSMPSNKRWCLLSGYRDRTMIRNAVAFEIARKCPALEWTPRGEFVEVVLNGKHMGNYYLCEQIRVGKNRVNIAELDNTVTEGDGITGGFIMEVDSYYDEDNKFKSSRRQLPWMFKDPSDINGAQFSYMRNYVNAMEDALYDPSRFAAREFTNYMDLESFVDWWFVNELTMNSEPNGPRSCYMTKDENGPIKAGPVWDFDYSTFTPLATSVFSAKQSLYYGRLFEDEAFKALVKTKWSAQKSKFETVVDYIDSLSETLAVSEEIDRSIWPIIISFGNWDECVDYMKAVERMKRVYLDKLNWMDAQISSW